ncbi:LacI family DNA-binding transcriptional regulator [Caproiciproducens galactitolivorans]|uniref:LacI family DNA-binding transcriptional regulator n=1 Tax=Caproiciproducens galactitolivorans TaxID=642589 RepID=A0ABT4BRI3_9FIRM|nr:LacI family DNA-binding transcriptional regulator [Caproiciproducens galactitolivorans]MCY1713429.1 LacI family DNA-binding transcriptional regulator [Caproiciproducens galactitolivorans]
MRTTVKDVAKAVGLSTTTVSLVLNNKPNRIPKATREIVLKAAKDLNYRPNHIAVSMVTKKTHTIGLILPDISNLYFSELAKVIEEQFHKYGYNVLYGNTNGTLEHDFEYLNLFIDRSVDAVIMTVSSNYSEKEIKSLHEIAEMNNVPIMMVDRTLDDPRFMSVLLDQKLGGYLATNYLIHLGHRKIACITGPKSLRISIERLEGYKSALQDAGLPFDPALIVEGDFRVDSGVQALPYILGQNATAVFSLNDMMAIGVYRECRRYHLSIPQDLSIVGFDDIFIDEFLEPPLSTIAQPVVEIGEYAVKKMMTVLEGEEDPSCADTMVFKPALKVRGSASKFMEKKQM